MYNYDMIPIKKLKKDTVFRTVLKGNNFIFHTTWGLFSPKEIDQGTRLLIDTLEVPTNGLFLDIGCGYGPIGLVLAKMNPQANVHLIDRDFVAVEYAGKNARKNHIENCEIYLSNGFSNITETGFDLIVSNIPAKTGKELYWILIADSYKHLKQNGKMYLVFISHLSEFFKRNMKEIFGNYMHIGHDHTYSVVMAEKP